MNRVISDTAEYGCYLFANVAAPMMEKDLMPKESVDTVLSVRYSSKSKQERLIMYGRTFPSATAT